MSRSRIKMLGLAVLLTSIPERGLAESSGSSGCGSTAAGQPGETFEASIEHDGLERSFRVHLPKAYDADRPTSLVLDFHGYTGTAESEESYTGLSDHADAHGYVVVYPQGTGFVDLEGRLVTSWNDGAGSASPGPAGPICSADADHYPIPPECGDVERCNWATCHDDVGFIEQLLDRLEADVCVDLDRVYATGMSNGGMFVHRLGCDLAARFAAIAPVGGTLARGFNCAPSTPISMINIWGRGDHYVSQEREMSTDGYYYTSATDLMRKWADSAAQNCDSEVTSYPTEVDGTLGMSCRQHANCGSGAEVVHCTWDGEHDWPQLDETRPGNQLIWEFFAKHSRANYPKHRESSPHASETR